MRLLQHITESFNRPYPFYLESNYNSDYEYRFEKDDGTLYYVSMFYRDGREYTEVDNIFQKVVGDDISPDDIGYFIITFSSMVDRNKRERSYKVTGTGDAQRVLATVLIIIKDFIKREKKPQFIVFGATEKSRRKLYERMVKILSSKFGYKLIGTYVEGKDKNYVLWNGVK